MEEVQYRNYGICNLVNLSPGICNLVKQKNCIRITAAVLSAISLLGSDENVDLLKLGEFESWLPEGANFMIVIKDCTNFDARREMRWWCLEREEKLRGMWLWLV